MLNLSIKKDANISIHQQLVTQLSLQIASGKLPEGSRLPSVRALSVKLGIHYNTCLAVYRELKQLGLIQARKGSGMVVERFKPQAVNPTVLRETELQEMAGYFIRIVQEKGYAWSEVLLALDIARKQHPGILKLIFVDAFSDILPVFQQELQRYVNVPVTTATLGELDPSSEAIGTGYVVSRYYYQPLKELLGSEDHMIMIDIDDGNGYKTLIQQQPTGALVSVVSCSQVILDMAESVISGLRGQDLLVNTMLMNELPHDFSSIIKNAKLIFCDQVCLPEVKKRTKKPVQALSLILERELDKLPPALLKPV